MSNWHVNRRQLFCTDCEATLLRNRNFAERVSVVVSASARRGSRCISEGVSIIAKGGVLKLLVHLNTVRK